MFNKVDFMMKQHDHLINSIQIADQKAAAIIAINVGVIYILNELSRAEYCPKWKGKSIAIAVALGSLLFSNVAALYSIYPAANVADSHVVGGDHTIPHKILKGSQEDYTNWVATATPEDVEREVAALVISRTHIRAWKHAKLKVSIWLLAPAYVLVIAIIVVHNRLLRKANASPQAAVPEVAPGPGADTPTLPGSAPKQHDATVTPLPST